MSMVTHELRTSGGIASFQMQKGPNGMMGVSALVPVREHGLWTAKWTIHEFRDPHDRIAKLSRKGVPIETLMQQFKRQLIQTIEIENNLLLNGGINQIWKLVCGTGGTQYGTGAYMAVGTSTTAANATQSALVATGTSSATASMDATYPTYGTSQQAVWRATYGTAAANFDWEEIAVLNAAAGTLLNRKTSVMGTKTSAVSRVATLTVTLS